MDARHALHEITGRPTDRLVLQEQDEVARVLGLLDADALMRHLAEAGRAVAYSVDQVIRQAQRSRGGRRRSKAQRRPLADGLVEQDGEVVLARAADPASDPALPLRAAAAAAQAGLVLAPRTLTRLAECPPLPVPWPSEAREPWWRCWVPARPPSRCGRRSTRKAWWRSCSRTGTGSAPPAAQPAAHLHRGPPPGRGGIPGRRAHPGRGPAGPAAPLRAAARHRQGLAGGPPGHRGGRGAGRGAAGRPRAVDADLVAGVVRHHLLSSRPPPGATRTTRRPRPDRLRGGRPAALELLNALANADGLATGPAAWNDWEGRPGPASTWCGGGVAAGRRVAWGPAAAPGRPGGAGRGGRSRRPGARLGGHRRRPGPARPAVAGGRELASHRLAVRLRPTPPPTAAWRWRRSPFPPVRRPPRG